MSPRQPHTRGARPLAGAFVRRPQDKQHGFSARAARAASLSPASPLASPAVPAASPAIVPRCFAYRGTAFDQCPQPLSDLVPHSTAIEKILCGCLRACVYVYILCIYCGTNR